MTELKTTRDYVLAFVDDDFKLTMHESLKWHEKEFKQLKDIVKGLKGLVEKDFVDELKEIDVPRSHWQMLWSAHWQYTLKHGFAKHVWRKLEAKAKEVSNLQEAVRVIKSMNQPERKGKITDQMIQDARDYPIDSLVGSKVIKAGKNRKVNCPVHGEKTPSFIIYPDNSFHCFGCGFHGNNAVDFIMKVEQLSFEKAVERLT